MMVSVLEIADDVFVGEGTDVSWLALREGRDLTLVDTGWPGDTDRLVAQLAGIGHTLDDVRAVLVTHAHVDHVGAVGLLAARGVPVHVGAAEMPNAHGTAHEQAAPIEVVRRSWRPSVAAWSLRIMRVGALSHPTLPTATPLPEPLADGTLDLPGHPVAVPCPGHTSGHTAYLVPGAGVLATGDALVTAHPTSRRDGPQLLPDFFTHDPSLAAASLDALAAQDADVVVPGHGPVWRGPVARAVEHARSAS